MAEVTSAMVKDLREKTGAGMMDCKKALVESDGDPERAVTWLREKGLGKAEAMLDRILPGKMEKYFQREVLLEQAFFRDPEGKRSVQDEINAAVALIKENIQVRRFTRYALGEGLKKEQKDFAAEVSAAVTGQK